jgi:hypothetical protein
MFPDGVGRADAVVEDVEELEQAPIVSSATPTLSWVDPGFMAELS